MATLVLTAIGASIGASAGGITGAILATAGAYVGSQVGGAIDGAIFGGGSRRAEGPRLAELSVQSSAYGAVAPLLYGTVRVAGNVIWSTGLVEERVEETQKVKGGKGGGSTKVTNVTYRYAASFAVALSARPIAGIGRIWADGKLLRDGTGRLAVDGAVRVHDGGEGQAPDPLIEARTGAGGTPAYRGLAYVVFDNLALAEYVNRIPNLTFEVIADSGGTAALSTVVGDLCARSGLADFDVSALTGEVKGYVLARAMTYRQAIEGLAEAYAFDAAEIDGRLVFAPLARAAVAAIPAEDLVRAGGDGEGQAHIAWTRAQEADLPREVAVRHMDPARDYQPGLQRARRLAGAADSLALRDLPLVLDGGQAKETAEAILVRLWRQRMTARLALPPRYARLTAGDVIEIGAAALVLHEVDLAGGIVECRAMAYAGDIEGLGGVAESGELPVQVIPDVAETVLYLLNLPPLTAEDLTPPRAYAALTSGDSHWRGGVIYRSADGGASFDAVAESAAPAVAGVAADALPPGPADYWDEGNSLTVQLLSADMALESRPDLALLNGANAALIGREIIQFRSAVLQGDGTYRLSGLLRGRRGTEHEIAGHGAGETFLLLEAATLRALDLAGAVGRADLYKAVSVGGFPDAVEAVAFTGDGANLKPFAPVHVAGDRDGAGNLTVTWIRRTRAGGDWIDGADVPLGEESERYEVDVLDGAAVVRTLAVGEPEVVYGAAQQVSDFGSLQAAVTLRVYQMSAVVGRGIAAEAVI